MDENKSRVRNERVNRTMEALHRNGMPAEYVDTGADAAKRVKELLSPGNTISCGGTVTLQETGIRELMKSGDYVFLDRETMPPEQAYAETFTADVFLTSANAITENGELYNVDGNGNRVAALIYGPKQVIVIAGVNKIVRNLQEAEYRVKTVAAPANGVRLDTGTPCAKTGRCAVCDGEMTQGCQNSRRMCCQYVVTGFQRTERIRVILVGEELGY